MTYAGEDYVAQINQMFIGMIRALHEAGAPVALGTDATNSYLVPGFSLHDEVDYLVQAGYSPYEAIQAGTRNAAEAMGKLDEFGTIEPGQRADFILAEANPLDDVANLRGRTGVMLRGRWLPQSQLDQMLSELTDSYRPSLIERVWPLLLVGLGVFGLGTQIRARKGQVRR